MDTPIGPSGTELYAMVERYSDFGIHRSGTEVDLATAVWIGDQLAERGIPNSVEPVAFERWLYTSSLLADATAVDHLPVYYEFSGSVDTRNVRVVDFDVHSGGHASILEQPIADAREAQAEALVLATRHPNGSLNAVNRAIDGGSGFPAVLVAGRDLDTLHFAHDIRLQLDAHLEEGATYNVFGHNQTNGPRLLLSTPLNGWFQCAGERGTGVAVFLGLVERLADLPLTVLATGGHELSFFGAYEWMASDPEVPAAVVQVGASVAVDHVVDDERVLIASRVAMTTLAAEDAAAIRDALEPIGLEPLVDTEQWLGEGEAFSQLGVPTIGFTGSGIDFHCPEDIPERATSPASLAAVLDAIEGAARAIYAHATS